jgi:hypothetical protein
LFFALSEGGTATSIRSSGGSSTRTSARGDGRGLISSRPSTLLELNVPFLQPDALDHDQDLAETTIEIEYMMYRAKMRMRAKISRT